MSPAKPKPKPRKPGAKPVDPAAADAFERRQAERENAVAGRTATLHARNTASPHSEAANPEARVGSLDKPYRKKDGVSTSSTTIHLPVDMHKRLRTAAVDRNVHMSKIVADAVAAWLEAHGA